MGNRFVHSISPAHAPLGGHVPFFLGGLTLWKKLNNCRVAFWDQQTKTIVVYDPNRRKKYNPNRGKKEEGLGTAFTSTTGKKHFLMNLNREKTMSVDKIFLVQFPFLNMRIIRNSFSEVCYGFQVPDFEKKSA